MIPIASTLSTFFPRHARALGRQHLASKRCPYVCLPACKSNQNRGAANFAPVLAKVAHCVVQRRNTGPVSRRTDRLSFWVRRPSLLEPGPLHGQYPPAKTPKLTPILTPYDLPRTQRRFHVCIPTAEAGCSRLCPNFRGGLVVFATSGSLIVTESVTCSELVVTKARHSL
jgi:hypothetical protein